MRRYLPPPPLPHGNIKDTKFLFTLAKFKRERRFLNVLVVDDNVMTNIQGFGDKSNKWILCDDLVGVGETSYRRRNALSWPVRYNFTRGL